MSLALEPELEHLALALQNAVKQPMQLRFNENMSTMISVRNAEGVLRVSLHKIFAKASLTELEALVCYIQGKQRSPGPVLRGFINEHHCRLNQRQKVREASLCLEGNTHNLKQIYDAVNSEYFDGGVDLKITWYGSAQRRRTKRVTFGLYYDTLGLIKVHRLLDSPRVPNFFVSYVVYHEILHHVLPAYKGPDGRNCIHHPAFKRREKEHEYYQQAKEWISANERWLFA